jgi:two-component system phosphate regulon response regulator PhoB
MEIRDRKARKTSGKSERMPKVMVVEDDANMFSLLQMLLEYEGYEVVLWEGSDNVQEIIDSLCEEKPDLILLDVHLRHLSGFDVLHGLREEAELDGVRVLIASGVDLTSRSIQEGADGFVLKPFIPDELIMEIKNTIS